MREDDEDKREGAKYKSVVASSTNHRPHTCTWHCSCCINTTRHCTKLERLTSSSASAAAIFKDGNRAVTWRCCHFEHLLVTLSHFYFHSLCVCLFVCTSLFLPFCFSTFLRLVLFWLTTTIAFQTMKDSSSILTEWLIDWLLKCCFAFRLPLIAPRLVLVVY